MTQPYTSIVVVDPGHTYLLRQLDSDEKVELRFVRRGLDGGKKHAGLQNQEVLRALIDRVKFLDAEKRWEGNDLIIYHLRMALVLHEARALIRKAEKGLINPENISISEKDGHFELSVNSDHNSDGVDALVRCDKYIVSAINNFSSGYEDDLQSMHSQIQSAISSLTGERNL